MKYIIVTGGVISGLGKGITASSIGRLLKSRGLNITAIKIDPYLNFDAGTLNPFEHGEVFVLDDGGEVDLDLGHYERFLDVSLTRDHNITTGKIYGAVIEKERVGHFLGKTVQIIPHITNEIKDRIRSVAHQSGADVCIIELGGTIGDIESMPYVEGMRQLHTEVGDENCIFVHTTLIPIVSAVGEQKTKPTQHSVKELRALGVQPDIIVARAEKTLDPATRKKISLFCDVPLEAVISAQNVKTIYEIPVIFDEQGLTTYLLNKMKMSPPDGGLSEWKDFIGKIKNPTRCVTICLIGKYMDLMDSYISHFEALKHAAAELETAVKFECIESEELEQEKMHKRMKNVNGILIPGGFGHRGIEGKIAAAKYARENDIPFLGVCLGFQVATIEFSRNTLNLEGANSSEFDPNTPHPVVDLLPEQRGVERKGATMRLGAQAVMVQSGTTAHRLYGVTEISERHRHRYEINPEYIDRIEAAGMKYTGRSPDGRRMEILEIPEKAFFVASQFHPEFKSRPRKPSRLHFGLVEAAVSHAEKKNR
ncbi:MAG: CTP synthase (glutamine hydrolyzing) [Thermoplasmata archaeon]|nr:CTP synthase (glutamine hydrolyzing) [Thermoplasmata archaeon]